jgi:hypothetical protein
MGGGLFISKKKRWTCLGALMSCARLESRYQDKLSRMLHDYLGIVACRRSFTARHEYGETIPI